MEKRGMKKTTQITTNNKDGRAEIEKVHPPTTWSTFAAVPLASILLFKRSRKRESEGTFALDDQSSFSGEAELPMRQCGEVK